MSDHGEAKGPWVALTAAFAVAAVATSISPMLFLRPDCIQYQKRLLEFDKAFLCNLGSTHIQHFEVLQPIQMH